MPVMETDKRSATCDMRGDRTELGHVTLVLIIIQCLQVNGVGSKESEVINANANLNDHLSQNITNLLENLLKNYDKTQRPQSIPGKPTVITTNLLIRSLGPISELHMTYQLDCYFRQSWEDSRLRFAGPIPKLSLSIKMLDGIWKPDTFFHNGHDSYVHTITVPNKLLRIKRNGVVFFSTRLTIKASCPMTLHNFPIDVQSCPLILGSFAYTKDQVLFAWEDQDPVSFISGMALSQFDLIGNPKIKNYSQIVSPRGEFSILQVNFTFQRHMGYFLIQIYIPCILIVVLSWVSFWINREATADRVGLGITTVLTLSTFGLDTRNDLPKVHYATALDWFVIMCFSFVIATLLEFAGVHYFTKVGSGEIEEEEEEAMEECGDEGLEEVHRFEMGLTSEGSPTSTTRSVPTQTEHPRPSWYLQFWRCLVQDRQKWDVPPDHINSVSNIDRVSRVLFPIVFGALNTIYWLFYSLQSTNVSTNN